MFWIPVAVAAATVSVAHGLNMADKNTNKANKISIKSINRIAEAEKMVKDEEEKAEKAVLQLANRKRGILLTSMPKFVSIYEKIMTINLLPSIGIKELENLSAVHSSIDNLKHSCIMVKNTPASGVEMIWDMLSMGGHLAICAGTATLAIEGSFAIGAMGTLNPLSLPFVLAGGAVSGIVRDSKKDISMANMRKKYANVVTAQAETNVEVIKAISERAVRLKDVLTNLNNLFIRTIDVTKEIIEKNGNDKSLYTEQDKDYIRNCLNFAAAVKAIIDTPLYDEEGSLTEVSKLVLERGESYLIVMENVMTS